MQATTSINLIQWIYIATVLTLCGIVLLQWFLCWHDFIYSRRHSDGNEETQNRPHETQTQRHTITVTAGSSESPSRPTEHPPGVHSDNHEINPAA